MSDTPYIMRQTGDRLWHIVKPVTCTTIGHSHGRRSACDTVAETYGHRVDNMRAHHQILLCSACLQAYVDDPKPMPCEVYTANELARRP